VNSFARLWLKWYKIVFEF